MPNANAPVPSPAWVVWRVLGMLAPLVQAQAQSVPVVMPESIPMIDRLRLSGTLSAERGARLSPRADGLVARLRVDAGDQVRAGQPLLEQDAVLARRALGQARSPCCRRWASRYRTSPSA